MNYPNGVRKQSIPISHFNRQINQTHSNRGMSLEEDINVTNQFYLHSKRAIIHKKPTPIQIVKVNYPKRSAAVITEAYFQAKSTTDYNGIYKGKHLDFEAKETKNKTSFPLANVHEHQVHHLQQIVEHGGICFMIIRFSTLNETYLLPAEYLLSFWEEHLRGGRKSMRYEDISRLGYDIPSSYQARVDYLRVIDALYF